MGLRLIAPVLSVIAATAAAALVLARLDSTADAWLVLATGLTLAAATAALAVTTQRRRRATREVERYFTLSPEMVIIAGFDGYWKRVNPAVETVLGYTEREALTRPFMEFVYPDDRERTEEEARRVVGGATALAFENRILCKDGSYKLIEWTVRPVPEERVMYGVGRDITQRRRSESEQAALRRLATMVAQGVPQSEVCSAVAEEAGRLLGTEEIVMLRYDSDRSAIVVARSGDRVTFPVGSRQQLDGDTVASRVLRTGRTARIDNYTEVEGPLAETARSIGVRAVVGAPISVQGRLWGAITTGSTSEPLPPDAESRLLHFTELMATAIANAEARGALQPLAEEQAALRRVATLVAQGVPPGELFAAVTKEVAHVFSGVEPPLTLIATVIRFDPGPECVLVGASRPYEREPIGSRWTPKELYVSTQVLRTGRSARVDEVDLKSHGGPDAEVLRLRRFLHQVGSPVIVEGRLWGAMTLNSNEALPPDTDERLENFTELVATAIANAESREALARLAEEQAALRRVATLVARGAPSPEVFEAVATEVAKLLETDITVLGRYDDDGAATAIGSWSASPVGVPVGTRSVIGGHNVLTLVAQTGKPARVEGYDYASGEAADIARRFGWSSSIAAPVIVEGRLWGVMLVATQKPEPFPVGAESRLAAFTDLVATAVANAQSYDEVRRFGNEQAALGRVATLVAAGSAPERVFSAVVDEVASLIGLERIELVRYDGDATGTVIAASGDHPFPAGSTWSLDDPSVMATVARTKQIARMDDYGNLDGEIARTALSAGFQSAIGAPITVEGRLWGVIIAISTDPEPIPERSEARLGQITELVATAVANADARHTLERVAAEQATLRRIATLVAEGLQPEEIFAAVIKEVGRLFGTDLTAVGRFEDDPPAFVAVALGEGMRGSEVGTSWAFDDPLAASRVFQARHSVRVSERLRERSAALADMLARLGVVSTVSSPIMVEGRLWGAVMVSSKEELPVDAEERLTKFTELVANAVANAEARAEVHRLADEQAALRRVAVLVAQQPSPSEVFTAVTEAVGLLLDADLAVLHVFASDHAATTVASWGAEGPILPIGTRFALDGDSLAARIFESGAPARMHSHEEAWVRAETALATSLHMRSAVGAPILVEGKLWGTLMAATRGVEPWAENAENRLAAFTELVATAIANAESRETRAVLTEEQAALRRIATLAAEGASPQVLFGAVAEAVGRLLPVGSAAMGRFEPGGMVTTVAAWSASSAAFPVGTRWNTEGKNVTGMVHRTGRSARLDDFSDASGPIGHNARKAGYRSVVGSPIAVEGHLWGVMTAASTEGQLPPDTEARLASFTELVATAISNAENRAELTASRRRIVAASDDARRRIERDLHDGVQQQLVSLGLQLGAMRVDPPTGDALKEQLASVTEDLVSVLDALVETARGIHPAILSQGGLEAALKGLARRSAVPVELHVQIEGSLPDEVEVAAYYVAAETLTNAAKHACASGVHMDAKTDDGTLMLIVRDNGVGGADPGRGSGLVGLQDRVEALGGTITIDSPAGSGTCAVVKLPIATEPDQEIQNLAGPLQEPASHTSPV